jgi:hypothetical protein
MYEKIILINLANPIFRKTLINKIKKGSSKYESDPEVDAEDLKILENWKKLSKEEKKAFATKLCNSESFAEGMVEGEKLKEKIKSAPGNAFKKIKTVFKKDL